MLAVACRLYIESFASSSFPVTVPEAPGLSLSLACPAAVPRVPLVMLSRTRRDRSERQQRGSRRPPEFKLTHALYQRMRVQILSEARLGWAPPPYGPDPTCDEKQIEEERRRRTGYPAGRSGGRETE